MNTIFMNSENGKTCYSHKQLLNITDKLHLRRKDKYITSSNDSIYYAWKNIKKSYKNKKIKISAPTWNEESELPDGSYYISDIQDYFEYTLKNHGKKTVNPSIRIYINKIEITFKIKTGYYLELVITETLKSLGSTNHIIKKDENGENVSYLEIDEVVLIYCLVLLIIFISKIQESCIHLFLINHLVNY